MDESSLENNSLMKKPRCYNRQVENTSNTTYSTSGAELISLDEINSNTDTDTKSSLLTRKQRIKEYFTTLVSEKNTTSTKLLQGVNFDEFINFVSGIDDHKKPVKVKSRWTLTSQMEEALENSSFPKTEITSPKNNLSCEIINEVSTMAFRRANILDMFNDNMNLTINNCNYDFSNTCSVVVEKCDALPLTKLVKQVEKTKRGRPKKTANPSQEKAPDGLNIVNKDLIESDSLNKLKSEDSNKPSSPLVIKRGRGRPKKIGITSNTVSPKPQVVLKRGRKKPSFTNVKKRSNVMEGTSLENGATSDISNDSELSTLDVNSDFSNTKEFVSYHNILNNDNSTTSCGSETNDNIMENKQLLKKNSKLLTCSIYLEKCDSYIEQQKTASIAKVKSIDYLKDSKQDLLIEFDKANWNIVPKQIKSKSLNGYTKTRHRRNSLSDNFVYGLADFSKTENDDMKLKKSWNSLSYLQGGPNIQIERYQQNELRKKFRTELKRSRSFPNCMLLDTVIWRFLVNEQSYYTDDNFMLSDSEINLLDDLIVDGYNHQYRSKSIPIEECKYKNENNMFLSRSLENLNMLSYTEKLPSFQINADECDLKNTESDSDECESKIRRSKRLNTKIKHTDMIDEKYLQESDKSKRNYLLLAEKIRNENEIQLSEARKNDQALEKKLKKLNFTLITNNLFRPHRKNMGEYTPAEAQELRKLKPRRIINADTYTCHCKYSRKDWIDGKPGCGPECINRLLNIECGSGCLLKSFCTNKQFQNKQFKRTEIVRTPNKGYGVFALEDIPSGTFVDEYMGEVIDQHQMIKRMKTKLYMNNNYMVQLKHDEIIDATRKGNITRFINHSCEPNCVAEKWNVLGESRMGFFTKVPIFRGEEITFDYSFEIFGDAAQQKCYCNALKCRGFISKKSRTGDQSSSDESDDNEDDILTSKTDEREEKKKKISIKKITNKDKKRLRELDQQLTDISKLKNKNRSDLESSTLNLNKLMVHITDSMSRSHILKFIRENDLNCKRLFMNFNGLSIIHSWMISSNNENLKLEIILTLSELPISNRNTITKSKVLDIVAEWAKIPFKIKEDIENLDYPVSKSEEHGQKIDKLLPDDKYISLLAQAARVLWKKWIILKMVFKIPKLERPKDVSIPNVIQPSIISSQLKSKPDQCYFGKPIITTSQNSETLQTQDIPNHGLTNPMDRFSKMIHHQIQINNQEKSKAVFEWNKKNWEYTSFKINKGNSSSDVNKKNHVSTSAFTTDDDILEIPTIESNSLSKKVKRSTPAEFTPAVYEVLTCDSSPKPVSTEIEPIDYNYIDVITTPNQTWDPPPLTIDELQNGFSLESILKTAPPCLSNNYVSNQCEKTVQYSNLYDSSLTLMSPENVMYEAQHPSIEEQSHSWSIEPILNNSIKTVIDLLETTSNENGIVIQPTKAEDAQKILFEQCQNNLKKLVDSGLLDISKSAKENFIDRSPIKITNSFFKKKSQHQLKKKYVLPNFFKRLKIISNFYREQPSKLVKIMNFESKCDTLKNKNDTFRIKEENKTEIIDATSVALKFHNEQLSTAPRNINIRKLLKNQTVEVNTENKFAFKIFNALKKNLNMPKQFRLKLPSDTKVITLDPKKEMELHHKLIPTVKNTLCAKLIKEDEKDTLNVFKQEVIMKYDETKMMPKPFLSLEEVFRENLTPENIARNKDKALKRKIPLNTTHKINVIKSRKTVDSPISKSNNPVTVIKESNNGLTLKNPITVTKATNDGLTFKNPVTVTKATNDGLTFKKPVMVTKATNDGLTFKNQVMVTKGNNDGLTFKNPVTVIKESNNGLTFENPITVTKATNDGLTFKNPVMVTKATDDGLTFKNPVMVTKATNDGLTFKNPITVTKATNDGLTFKNPITVTKATNYGLTIKNPVSVTKATNDGLTFKNPTMVTKATNPGLTFKNPVLVTKATNDGLTFKNPVMVTKATNDSLTYVNPVTVTKATNDSLTYVNPVTVTKATNDSLKFKNPVTDDFIFKKPMVPKRKSIHTNTTVNRKRREHVTSKPIIQSMAVLKKNDNEMRPEPSTSSQVMSYKTLLRVNANEVTQGPSTSSQTTQSITLLKPNTNEMKQKPLMKCLPFNKVNDISTTELEENAKNLATYLSMKYSTNELPISQPSNEELIEPIVDNFNTSINLKKTMNRTNLVDDPIVRDYIQRTHLKTLESKRKCKLPESMMSLPIEVLNLVPDNQREIKYVIDFYHSMATVIVKVLDSYVKKSCKQGRIKNDEDFKFIAKKLNSNILFKELQVRKVEELKISDSVKQKVEQYIKKYMLKYGKVYRRKSTDQ